jgi:hypothetical protein
VRQHANQSKKRTKQNRLEGYICHVGKSRSGIFWAIIKDANKVQHFAYGRNFVSFPAIPWVGQQVTFVRLPPLPSSKFPRAIEVAQQHNLFRISSKKYDRTFQAQSNRRAQTTGL